jgi:hypothetical protein
VPEFHVHRYNEDFYIIRQSGCSHYEKPFLYPGRLLGRGQLIELNDALAEMRGSLVRKVMRDFTISP